MTPPEPGPDPPTPPVETTVYTYSGSDELPIGSTTGVAYYSIKDESSNDAILYVKKNGNTVELRNIIINEVPAFQQTNYYFCNSNLNCCVLASNATIGGTHPYYVYDNNAMTQGGTVEVLSCTPSDYFDTIKSGEFEVESR